MVEKTEKSGLQGVIDRMKVEGALLRNTGTNSIKVTNQTLATVNNTLESLRDLFKEYIEFNRTGALRDSLNNNQNVVAPTRSESQSDSVDRPEGANLPTLFAAALASMAFSGEELRDTILGSGFITGIVNSVLKPLQVTLKTLDVSTIFGKAVSSAKAAMSGIGRVFRAVGSFLGVIGAIGPLGGLVAKFARFIPFVRAFTAITEFVSGFLDGYNEEGLFGGFREGFASLAGSFIGWPLNLLRDGLAWVLENVGLADWAATFKEIDFIKAIGDGVRGAFSVITDLFSWGEEDKTALGLLGKLTDIVYAPINLAINAVTGMFGWNDPENPFKLQDEITKAFNSAIGWISEKISFAGESIVGAWTSLTDFVSGKWIRVKAWFTNLLMFTSTAITDAWSGLTEFVQEKWTAVKDWFTGLLSWASEGLSDGWTNLTDFVQEKWTAVKNWFTDKLSWANDTAEEAGSFVSNLVKDAWESVKQWFNNSLGNIADGLPSIEDIKASLISNLPSWMIPDRFKTPEMRAQDIKNMIAEEQDKISRSEAGENVYYGFEGSGREKSASEIERLRQELAEQNKLIADRAATVTVNNVAQGGTNQATTSTILMGTGGGSDLVSRADRSY